MFGALKIIIRCVVRIDNIVLNIVQLNEMIH